MDASVGHLLATPRASGRKVCPGAGLVNPSLSDKAPAGCLFELALASMPGLFCFCDTKVLRSKATQSPLSPSLPLSPLSLHALLASCVLLCLGTAIAAFARAPCMPCFAFMFNATLWSMSTMSFVFLTGRVSLFCKDLPRCVGFLCGLLVWGFVLCVLKMRFGLRCCR